MNYYMTCKTDAAFGVWELCKARTLSGAKREATREYGYGFYGFIPKTLYIGVEMEGNDPRTILSQKHNVPGARWHDRW